MGTVHHFSDYSRNAPRKRAGGSHGSDSRPQAALSEVAIESIDLSAHAEPLPDFFELALRSMIAASLIASAVAASFGFAAEYAPNAALKALFLASTCFASMAWIVTYIVWLCTRDG